jgi:hypothetical protein
MGVLDIGEKNNFQTWITSIHINDWRISMFQGT